ncbi:MAG: hypothetical protein K2X47_04695 [Bdellovibrionales bacterium]|nr:hypothetical protein [Bdellovibrionales bacterium]
MSNLIRVDFKEGQSRGLELVLMPGRLEMGAQELYHQGAFELWKNIWSQTLRDLDGLDYLPSDQFTRQDLVAGLFLKNKCIGLTCFRKADLKSSIDRSDSWFKPWPETTMIELSQKYPQAAANSFFTIHPDFRKTTVTDGKLDLPVSLLMAEFVATIAFHSAADATYGVTRNNRSVNKLAYHGGATPVAVDQTHHGVLVDLIAYYPEKLRIAMEGFLPATSLLWKNRIIFTDYGFQKGADNAKTA